MPRFEIRQVAPNKWEIFDQEKGELLLQVFKTPGEALAFVKTYEK